MRIIRHIGSLAFVLGLFVTIFAGIPWHVLTSDDPVVPWWLRIAVFALLGGILIVLATLALERRPTAAMAPPEPPEGEDLLLVNTADVPGQRTQRVLGLVEGHTVYAVWLGRDLSALVRLMLGGELTEYTEMMAQARATATQRMLEQARHLGADAVTNVRYMTTSVVGTAAELFVYGTAVQLGA